MLTHSKCMWMTPPSCSAPPWPTHHNSPLRPTLATLVESPSWSRETRSLLRTLRITGLQLCFLRTPSMDWSSSQIWGFDRRPVCPLLSCPFVSFTWAVFPVFFAWKSLLYPFFGLPAVTPSEVPTKVNSMYVRSFIITL